VNILGHDIAAVKQTGGHVLAVARVTLDHLVVGLEARHANLLNAVGFVRRLGGRDNWSVCNKREMYARVGYEVGLELIEIDVEGAVEAKGGGDGGNDCA